MHHIETDTDHPITELEEDTAWGYLDSSEVGRLATALGGQPDVFPVNYVVDGQSVVFRTAEGTKLAEVVLNQRVAFEADGWDESAGWSVVLRGNAERITDADELALAEKMPLRPWTNTVKAHFVRIVPDTITGRYFRFGS
ncbi:pyridoxamine 5'-phosphate oxidase family protein [Propionibacteriaceae bacterium G1746]|uniref:pyridoxamine 5'-phosphate oxidase family protein n=1 Tax=Aestuariimicrobium sp. G57 TaxID=3418485 RepID=UPI003C1F33EA